MSEYIDERVWLVTVLDASDDLTEARPAVRRPFDPLADRSSGTLRLSVRLDPGETYSSRMVFRFSTVPAPSPFQQAMNR